MLFVLVALVVRFGAYMLVALLALLAVNFIFPALVPVGWGSVLAVAFLLWLLRVMLAPRKTVLVQNSEK